MAPSWIEEICGLSGFFTGVIEFKNLMHTDQFSVNERALE
jgi:hypothetical protein